MSALVRSLSHNPSLSLPLPTRATRQTMLLVLLDGCRILRQSLWTVFNMLSLVAGIGRFPLVIGGSILILIGDWRETFQRIPTLVDDSMGKSGASRIVPRGLTDAAKGNMLGDFEDWVEQVLWPSLDKQSPNGPIQENYRPMFDVEVCPPIHASSLREDVEVATVVEARKMTAPCEPAKHHLEIELPEHMTYECGDYLAVLPENSEDVVARIMKRFDIERDSTMVVRGQKLGALPRDTPLLVRDVLKSCVELSDPASKNVCTVRLVSPLCWTNQNKQTLRTCLDFTSDPDNISKLESMLSNVETFEREILDKHISILDLLELHETINLPFSEFLASLTPTRVRHYSIASSPLASPTKATITYAQLSGPALSGNGDFQGVTGAYLSTLKPGDKIQVSVRPSSKALFKLPPDPDTPLLMFSSGTGVAPFRGFVQQRAIQLSANPSRALAPALLCIGCRSESRDRLYGAEFDAWSAQGVVDVRYAFSRDREQSQDCAYVQERLLRDEEDVVRLWRKGARVYVCGSGGFVKEVSHAAQEIVRRKARARGEEMSAGELETFFRAQMAGRTAADVFG